MSLRAASRTPCSPCDTAALLWVGSVCGSMLFSLIHRLPSASSVGCTALVRRLRRYYAVVRLPSNVHEGSALLSCPSGPPLAPHDGRCRDLLVPVHEFPCVPGVCDSVEPAGL